MQDIDWAQAYREAKAKVKGREPSSVEIWAEVAKAICLVREGLRFKSAEPFRNQEPEKEIVCVICLQWRGKLIYLFFANNRLIECRLDSQTGAIFATLALAMSEIDHREKNSRSDPPEEPTYTGPKGP